MKLNKQQFSAFLQQDRRQLSNWRRMFPAPPRERPKRISRASIMKRHTPPWADRQAIRCIYAECILVSHRTGIKHHVDHIIPLLGENVCGLHIPLNLQIIPATANIWKHNSFDSEWCGPK